MECRHSLSSSLLSCLKYFVVQQWGKDVQASKPLLKLQKLVSPIPARY